MATARIKAKIKRTYNSTKKKLDWLGFNALVPKTGTAVVVAIYSRPPRKKGGRARILRDKMTVRDGRVKSVFKLGPDMKSAQLIPQKEWPTRDMTPYMLAKDTVNCVDNPGIRTVRLIGPRGEGTFRVAAR